MDEQEQLIHFLEQSVMDHFMDKQEQLIGISDAAARFGVHKNTVRRWIDAGRLKAYWTPGGKIRIKASDLVEVLKPVTGGVSFDGDE